MAVKPSKYRNPQLSYLCFLPSTFSSISDKLQQFLQTSTSISENLQSFQRILRDICNTGFSECLHSR